MELTVGFEAKVLEFDAAVLAVGILKDQGEPVPFSGVFRADRKLHTAIVTEVFGFVIPEVNDPSGPAFIEADAMGALAFSLDSSAIDKGEEVRLTLLLALAFELETVHL